MEQLGVKGILNAWRKFGARGFAENLLLKIVSLLIFGRVERKLILAKSLENLPPETSETGFVIREIRPSEMSGNAADQFEKHPGDFAAFGAFSPSGELAAQGWICFRTFGWCGADAFGGGVYLEPGDAYFFMDWTAPQYRGRGLHKEILLARLRECAARGLKRAVIRVDGFNRASRKGISRAGFRELESFFIVKSFGKIRNGMHYGIRKNKN